MDASKVFNVGPHALDEHDLSYIPDDRLWLVVWYEGGSYDGCGVAAALRPDGDIEYADLSHCSCYGPTDGWDGWANKPGVPLAEFLTYDKMDHAKPDRERAPHDYDRPRWEAVVAKVRELVTRG